MIVMVSGVAALGHFAAEGAALLHVLRVFIPGRSDFMPSLGTGLLPGECLWPLVSPGSWPCSLSL